MKRSNFSVKCYQNDYDIGAFLKHHPGGVNYLQNYKNRDVRSRMNDTSHSKSAYYLLREYKVGGRDQNANEDNEDLEVLFYIITRVLYYYYAIYNF